MLTRLSLKKWHGRKRGLLICVGLLALWWLAAAHLAGAHGGGTIHVAGETTGPYRVTVWVAPNEVEAGKKLHFTVAVVSAADNQMVLDADVLMVVLAEETAVLSGPATTAQSLNKLFYEADFDAPAIGNYQVEAQVSGAAGAGAVSFDLTVQPARQNNLLIIGLIGLLLVSGLGLLLSRRGDKAD